MEEFYILELIFQYQEILSKKIIPPKTTTFLFLPLGSLAG